MFLTLSKNVDGRRGYRYFHKWENAEKAMLEDVENIKRSFDAKVVRNLDYFNADKGFYIRQIELLTPQNENFTYAILDSYFEDEE